MTTSVSHEKEAATSEFLPSPLDDLLVIDASPMMPGQVTAMVLGDLGARVVKIERPGTGDFARGWIPGNFESVNRNKEGMTLDLKHPDAVAVLHRLISRADVFLEGWRPGVADRLGAGYETLAQVQPRLVYCSVSGYGQTGPYRDLPGHDLDFLATAGVLSLAGDPNGGPEGALGASMADLSGAWLAAISILAALRVRDRVGIGQHIDIALGDAAFGLMQSRLVEYLVNGRPDKSTLMTRPDGIFATRDQRHLSIGVNENHFWRALCEALEITDWGALPQFATNESRRRHWPGAKDRLSRVFREEDRDHWIAALRRAGVPCAPVNDLGEALDDPHAKDHDIVQWMAHPTIGNLPQVRFPGVLSATPAHMRSRPPLLGEHTDQVLVEIGFGTEEIRALRYSGAI